MDRIAGLEAGGSEHVAGALHVGELPAVIFVDSKIPMYIVGAPHPNKQLAQHLLERAILEGERLVSDTGVLIGSTASTTSGSTSNAGPMGWIWTRSARHGMLRGLPSHT